MRWERKIGKLKEAVKFNYDVLSRGAGGLVTTVIQFEMHGTSDNCHNPSRLPPSEGRA